MPSVVVIAQQIKEKRRGEQPIWFQNIPAWIGLIDCMWQLHQGALCVGIYNQGGTSLCRVYEYVSPTRVDFSLPKIQNRPQILKFYSRTGSFLTIWSQTPCSNVKIPVAFSFCFLQPDVFTFVLLYLSKCFKLSITFIICVLGLGLRLLLFILANDRFKCCICQRHASKF